jgi:hypothetical protein
MTTRAVTQSERFGQLLAALGGVLVVGFAIQFGYSVLHRPLASCPAEGVAVPPDFKGSVYAPDGQTLVGNGALCIAVNSKLYFAEPERKSEPTTVGANANANASGNTPNAATNPPAPAPAATGGASPASTPPPAPQTAAKAGAHSAAGAEAELALFLDGERTPVRLRVFRDAEGWTWQNASLRLPSNASSDEARDWCQLLSGPTEHGQRPVEIGVGDPKEATPRAIAGNAQLLIYQPWRVWAFGIGLLMLVGGTILWGWQTGLLRDRPVTTDDPNPPFSLGRSQMAFWFLVTLAGYLYIWFVTAQAFGVIGDGVLMLLGISGVTGLAAVTMDRPDPTKPPPTTPSKGFWLDILSDGKSIVLHRIQMVVWTGVLGLIFAWTVATTYSLPTFDAAMLLLIGIANGTYIGFKNREPLPS